ncbi:MAG: zinc-dependent alcohol dehydrogenase family protein [Kiloniellales bacterium]|nr:zinc-dependent alcohol dehydrogenase family protein [Kiloniellales bacterium]
MKTRAAVLYEMGLNRPYAESRPLVIEELDLAPPGDGEILVRVKAAGLCHSDLSVIDGNRPRPLPMAVGHEAAGIVEELGPGVSDLEVGDHVVLVFVPSCGHCLPCMDGRPALCEPGAVANGAGTLLSGARRFSLNGAPVNHQVGVSAFSEHVVVSRRSVVKVDRSLPLEEAALFGCAVLTGVGAVVNTAKVPPGATIAVVGLGGVGLNALLGGILAGARRCIAVDIQDDKLALARQLGATDTFNAGDADCVEQLREATSGGVDYAFEMVGSVKAMDLAYRITGRGGTTVSAGLSHPDHDFALKHVTMVAEERTIKGSYLGSCIPARDVPNLIALYQQGRLPIDRLLSDRIGLEEVNAGFDRLASGQTVRQVLVM